MIRAYDETYLDDAMNNLGDMFDYAVIDCGYEAEDFFSHFIISRVAAAFERGNPKYIAGMSGPELASEVIYRVFRARPDIPASENADKSPEYWAGWILAYYQWYSARGFKFMRDNGLNMERVLRLYPTLHEADLTKFVDIADQIIHINRAPGSGGLRKIRKASGMTQKTLADKSGAALRMIQLYEQGKKDINKAQALTLARVARALGCDVVDLLE